MRQFNRSTSIYRLAALCTALFITTLANALPVIYSEATSGDLTTTAIPFVFDAGNNTISGNTHLNVNAPGRQRFDTDFDNFSFMVPTGLEIVGISLSLVTTAFNTSSASFGLQLCRGSDNCGFDPGSLLGAASIDLLGIPFHSLDFGLSLPLSAGVYSLFTSSLGIGIADRMVPQAFWSADYMFSFNVKQVPEPSVLGLLVAGLASLVVLTRAGLKRLH